MMADDLTFSKVCGENVKLNNERKAEWKHVYSGGILLSSKPLTRQSGARSVELNGSSHVDIGFVEKDPSRFERVRDIYDQNLKVLNSIKLHKRRSRVNMFIRDDMVVSVYGEKEFQLEMTGSEIWMVIYIKFGDAVATAEDRFNDICGENIEFLRNSNKTAAKLRILNPAAVCMVHKTLSPEAAFRLKVRINPLLDDNGRPPSRYHVVLGISDLPPNKWYDCDSESLSISQRNVNPVPWRRIETFTKENAWCPGEVLIERKGNGSLAYEIGTSKRTCDVLDWCCVVFELFRTSIEILSNEDYSYEAISKGDKDVSIVTPVSQEYDDALSENSVEMRKKYEAREPVENSYSEKCSSWLSSRINSMEVILDKDRAFAIPEFGDKLNRILKDLKSDDSNYETLDPGGKVEHIYSRTTSSDTDPGGKAEHIYSRKTSSDADRNPDLSSIKNQLDRIEHKIQEVLQIQKEGQPEKDTLYANFKEIKTLMLQRANTPSLTTYDCNTTRTYINMESVIQKNYTELVKSIDAQPLSDVLYQNGFLNTDQHDKILRMRKTDAAEDINRELLTFLRRVKISSDEFHKLLIKYEHGYLVEMFK